MNKVNIAVNFILTLVATILLCTIALAHEGETFLASPGFLDRSGRATQSTATEGGASPSEPGPHPESFSGQRYLVQRLLGEGGQKQVFLARDSGLEREVAKRGYALDRLHEGKVVEMWHETFPMPRRN